MKMKMEMERKQKISNIFKKIREIEPIVIAEGRRTKITKGKRLRCQHKITEKLKKMYDLLKQQPRSMEELANELGVSRRTANNYLIRLSKKIKYPFTIERDYYETGLKYNIVRRD